MCGSILIALLLLAILKMYRSYRASAKERTRAKRRQGGRFMSVDEAWKRKLQIHAGTELVNFVLDVIEHVSKWTVLVAIVTSQSSGMYRRRGGPQLRSNVDG